MQSAELLYFRKTEQQIWGNKWKPRYSLHPLFSQHDYSQVVPVNLNGNLLVAANPQEWSVLPVNVLIRSLKVNMVKMNWRTIFTPFNKVKPFNTTYFKVVCNAWRSKSWEHSLASSASLQSSVFWVCPLSQWWLCSGCFFYSLNLLLGEINESIH